MTSPTRSGADRRVAVLSAELAAHLPPAATPAPLRVPAAARAAHLAARRGGDRARPPRSWSSCATTRRRIASPTTSPPGCPPGTVRVLSERAALPLERALPEHDESGERLEVLDLLAGRHHHLVVVAPLLALVQRTLSPAQLAAGAGLAAGRRADRPAGAADRPGRRRLRGGGRGERGRRVREPRRDRRRLAAGRGRPAAARAVRRRGRVDARLRPDDPGQPPPGRAGRAAARQRVPARRWLAGAGRRARRASRPRRCRPTWRASSRATWPRPPRRGRRCSPPARPRDHLPPGAHVVLTDPAELRAIAADLDRQATERRDGLVASGRAARRRGRCRTTRPRPSPGSRRAPPRCSTRAAADAGYATAPSLPGRTDRIGAWLADLAAGQATGGDDRPGQPRRRAARGGGSRGRAGRRAA